MSDIQSKSLADVRLVYRLQKLGEASTKEEFAERYEAVRSHIIEFYTPNSELKAKYVAKEDVRILLETRLKHSISICDDDFSKRLLQKGLDDLTKLLEEGEKENER